ncbi:MAG: SpoIID/LytB domain-containing protein [Elusimicrobiaceae bacterium]|nr:SpoIID/LytB domain-containing protein [Elusimicrobiaceae bacterium]
MRKIRFFSLIIAVTLSAACAVPSASKKVNTPSTAAPAVTPQTPPTVTETKPETLSPTPDEPPQQAPKPDQSSSGTALRIVRVLLADGQQSASIKHSGRVYVYTKNLDKKYKISAEGTLAIKALGYEKIQVGSLQSSQPIILEPAKDVFLTWNNNVYLGKIFIVPFRNTFLIVEHADLETYLYGVLPYEMSYSWPLEALKAQAVAARTYTLKTIENVKTKHFDVYSDVRSQVYKGGGKQYDSVRKAVDETKNEVLTYEDKLFYTYYHGNCGGGTDDVRSWNPTHPELKPLSGAPCSYDSHSKSYSWKTDVPHSKITAYAQQEGLGGSLKSIKIAKKTNSGRATRITLRTSKGTKIVACNKFRLAIGLKSCKISKIDMHHRSLHIAGHGYGHGIGMCQDGANGMAKAGKNYRQILKNYYPGSKLTTLK